MTTPLSKALAARDQVRSQKELSRKETSVESSASVSDEDSTVNSDPLQAQINELLSISSSENLASNLFELRKFIMKNGLTNVEDSTIRVKVWKLLLDVPIHLDVEEYINRVEVSLPLTFEVI